MWGSSKSIVGLGLPGRRVFLLLWGLLKSFFLSVAFCWTVFAHYNGTILSFQQRPGGDGPFPGSKSTRGGSDTAWIPLQPCLKKKKIHCSCGCYSYILHWVPMTPLKSMRRHLPNLKVLIKAMKSHFFNEETFFFFVVSIMCTEEQHRTTQVSSCLNTLPTWPLWKLFQWEIMIRNMLWLLTLH